MQKLLLLILCLVLVTGCALAEPITINASFPATADGAMLTQQATLDEHWFDAPSSIYNHQLAQLSACMMVAAFRDRQVPLEESNHYIVQFFKDAGFEQYQAYGYDQMPRGYTISNSIAMKRLSDECGDYVLLAAPVCGQGYGDEWMSNFYIDKGEDHRGFSSSAETVYKRVKDYIVDNHLEGQRIKVWCAGFSRAAAVSNILGHLLLTDDAFDEDNIFVYTFGTPNTTKSPVAHPQIFNICGSFDPVPKIPFAEWGYGKHGTAFYLPSLETDAHYAAKQEQARTAYEALMGSDDGFASLTERNWLISEILEMINDLVPEAKIYSEGYQTAVIAAVSTKGSLLDKLNAMLSTLELSNEDTDGITRMRDELMALTSLGVTDTIEMLSGLGGSSMWYDLLSSGNMLAHEHFPEMYLSWLFSTNDPAQLFEQGNRFARLMIVGNVDVTITDGDTVLLDPESSQVAALWVKDQLFVSLPAGKSYQVTVTPWYETRCSIGFCNASTARVSMPLSTTNTFTLYPDEYITVTIPDCSDPHGTMSVKLNGKQQLPVHASAERDSSLRHITKESAFANEEMRYFVNSAVVMVPWLMCSTALIVYALVILVRRIIRPHPKDRTTCRRAGKVFLILAAIIAIVVAIVIALVMVLEYLLTDTVTLSNKTLQRASDFLGMSTNFYQGGQMVVYWCIALLSIRAIRHRLSRIRLVRLASAVLLLDVITLFLGVVFQTNTLIDYLLPLVPLLGMLGCYKAADSSELRRREGKRWHAVVSAVVVTTLVFLLRQSFVYIFGVQTTAAVVMKALSGLPILLLALWVWKQHRTDLSAKLLLAFLCYFVANTVINLSMPVALIIYTVGHGLLIAAFIRLHRPSKLRLGAWALIALPFELQLIFMVQRMDLYSKLIAFVYIIAIVGMLVTGTKVSRRMRLGVVLFMISNQILSITLIFPGDFLLESVELLLFYIAGIVMAAEPMPTPVMDTDAVSLLGDE